MILATTTLIATTTLATTTFMRPALPGSSTATTTPPPIVETTTTQPKPIPAPTTQKTEATSSPAITDPTFPSNLTPVASLYARNSHLSAETTRGLLEVALVLAAVGYMFTQSERVRRVLLRVKRGEAPAS